MLHFPLAPASPVQGDSLTLALQGPPHKEHVGIIFVVWKALGVVAPKDQVEGDWAR